MRALVHTATVSLLLSGMLLLLAACPDSVAPKVAFLVAPQSGRAPINIQFTDQSTVGSSPLTAWSWDFGDGKTSELQNPVNTYIAAGDYSVSLTVKDESGLVASASATISVQSQDSGNLSAPTPIEGQVTEGDSVEGQVAEGQSTEGDSVEGELPGNDVILAITPTALDFGDSLTRIEIELSFDPFSTAAEWRVLDTNDWLDISPTEGNGGARLVLTLNRARMSAEAVSGNFKVTGPKNEVKVFVTARR